MNTFRIAAAVVALALVGSAASAATLVNTDKTPYRINFMPTHGKVKHIALAAGHQAKFNCDMGGTLTFGKVTQQCDAKTRKLTIKDSKFMS